MGNGLKRWRRGRRIGWSTAVVAAVLLSGAAAAWALAASPGTVPSRPVTVAVDRGVVAVEVATSGTLQPATSRSLSFTVAGTVQTVSVRPGSLVQAGQRLAEVTDDDIAGAAEAVRQAEDDLTEAREALTRARDAAANGTTGCPTGSVTGARVASAPAANPGPTSVAPAQSATSVAPTGGSRPTAGTTAGGPTRAPAVPTRTTGTCAGDGIGRAGGSDPILLAQRQVNQAESVLAAAREVLTGATITAPIRGTVLSVVGKVGSEVAPGATFITLADTYAMQVVARFPEADAAAIVVGQEATATLADRQGQSFPATVVQVDPVGTSDGTMVRYGVVLSFTSPPRDLLVGQSATVVVRTGAATDVLRVPSTAVHDVRDRTGTVRVGAEGTSRTVTIGLRGGQFTEVTSGLNAGDLVLRSW